MSFTPNGSSPVLDPSLLKSSFTTLPTASNPPTAAPSANPSDTSLAVQESTIFRSCFTCRRRKIRCNRRSPCSNCVKGGIECIYPPPGRARRKSKPQDAELLSRLKRLEGVIENLKGNTTDSTASTASNVASLTPRSDDVAANKQPPGQENGSCRGSGDLDPTSNCNNSPKELHGGLGRLVIEEGRSRYVSNRLWASLGDEVEELQDILDPTSSEDEDSQTPDSTSTRSSTHDSFLFSFYPISHSLRNYHPPPEKILILWDAYLENVAPLVTVIHKPIAKRRMAEAAQRCDTLDKNSEALVFSIYLAAVVSMSSEECLNTLGESRDAAVKRYRFAVEQALAKANLLNTQSLVLLQAAVLFLIGVRAADDSKFVWSMTALVLRLAQGLGLHRDGTNFGLSPFETEMRRRLWWHISVLDIRSSEDHGTDFQIHDGMYDTKLPLNVNDEDLSPEMQASPNERAGCTDMTFSLIRFEITNALRHVNCSCPRVRFQAGNNALSSGGCGTMIRCINDRVEQRYLKYCDMSVPLHWVCATVARLILAKLWLIVHHPMTGRRDPERNLTHESRESLFLSSIEVLEFSRLLQLNEYTAKWGWMSHTNTPWHAVAFVLSELCVRPVSPVTDRAWAAASSVYRELDHKQKKGMLWRPLSRLVKRAAAVRAEQQGQMQAQFGDRTAQEGLSQLSNIQDSPTEQVFPQIPIPPLPQGPTSNQSGAPFGTGSGVDFDISKGPIGALNDLFPNTDLLTGANIPSAAQQQFEGMDAPVGISPDMATPIGGQQSMPNTQLSWDDWDQVMRDFQMDVQRAEVRQIGNFSDWFV